MVRDDSCTQGAEGAVEEIRQTLGEELWVLQDSDVRVCGAGSGVQATHTVQLSSFFPLPLLCDATQDSQSQGRV